jgi:hypothetical protein
MENIAVQVPHTGAGLILDRGLLVLDDGSILVTGEINLALTLGDSVNYFRAVVALFHPDGSLGWAQQYLVDVDTTGMEPWQVFAGLARKTADGGVVVVGSSNDIATGGDQSFAMKLDPYDGVLDPISTPLAMTIAPSTLVAVAPPTITASPTSPTFNASMPGTAGQWSNFAQYDTSQLVAP